MGKYFIYLLLNRSNIENKLLTKTPPSAAVSYFSNFILSVDRSYTDASFSIMYVETTRDQGFGKFNSLDLDIIFLFLLIFE